MDFINPKGVSLYLTHSIGASVMNFICFPCLTIISIKPSSNDNFNFSDILWKLLLNFSISNKLEFFLKLSFLMLCQKLLVASFQNLYQFLFHNILKNHISAEELI